MLVKRTYVMQYTNQELLKLTIFHFVFKCVLLHGKHCVFLLFWIAICDYGLRRVERERRERDDQLWQDFCHVGSQSGSLFKFLLRREYAMLALLTSSTKDVALRAGKRLRTVVYGFLGKEDGFETVKNCENDRQRKNSFTVQKTGKNVWSSGRKCPSNRKKTRATVDLVCSVVISYHSVVRPSPIGTMGYPLFQMFYERLTFCVEFS